MIKVRSRINRTPSFGARKFSTVFAGLLAGAFIGAGAAVAAPPIGTYGGGAYGMSANARAGPVATSLGRAAGLGCPCDGTGDQVKKRTADSISAGTGGLVLKAGSVSDTVFTTSTATDAVVKNTSRVDTLTLFNGLVGVNSVLAVAHTTADATSITSTDHGSKFDGLVVNGNPVAPDVAPNTDLVLPGIGHVRLREVIRSGNGTGRARIDVNMIHVVVDKTNPFLPIGSDIIVAHAASAFSRTATQPASISGSAWAAAANSNIGNLLQNEIGK